jgi:hypothetical protein
LYYISAVFNVLAHTARLLLVLLLREQDADVGTDWLAPLDKLRKRPKPAADEQPAAPKGRKLRSSAAATRSKSTSSSSSSTSAKSSSSSSKKAAPDDEL